jgi:hypothetical protein
MLLRFQPCQERIKRLSLQLGLCSLEKQLGSRARIGRERY